MELEYIKVQKYDRTVRPCPYNDACRCDQYQRTRCHRCGWNPKVAEKRVAKLMGKECKA